MFFCFVLFSLYVFVCSLFSIFATFVKKTILRNSYSLVMLKCKCSYYYILLILIQNCSNTLISKGCEICKTNHSREKKIHGWLCWWSILYDTTIKTQFFLANFRTIKVIICIKIIMFFSHFNYRTCAIIRHGLYIFYPIFHCGLYCRAVSITDNLCTKQGNSSIFKPKFCGL